MEDSNKKKKEQEELEKEEAERKEKLAAAKKEIDPEAVKAGKMNKETDEQESDGSANAFENK